MALVKPIAKLPLTLGVPGCFLRSLISRVLKDGEHFLKSRGEAQAEWGSLILCAAHILGLGWDVTQTLSARPLSLASSLGVPGLLWAAVTLPVGVSSLAGAAVLCVTAPSGCPIASHQEPPGKPTKGE